MAEVCKANQRCLLELERVAGYSWHLVHWKDTELFGLMLLTHH